MHIGQKRSEKHEPVRNGTCDNAFRLAAVPKKIVSFSRHFLRFPFESRLLPWSSDFFRGKHQQPQQKTPESLLFYTTQRGTSIVHNGVMRQKMDATDNRGEIFLLIRVPLTDLWGTDHCITVIRVWGNAIRDFSSLASSIKGMSRQALENM